MNIHTESGCVLLTRDDMTAAECVGVMKLLTDTTVELMTQLAHATREAAEENDCDDCIECEWSGCTNLSIPPCMLEQANIAPDHTLTAAVEKGRIVITAAEEDDGDPLNQLDKVFLATLGGAGVNLSGLRFLLENEGRSDG